MPSERTTTMPVEPIDRVTFFVVVATQFAITILLLFFIRATAVEAGERSLILGAIVAHWLKESVTMGRQAAASGTAKPPANGHDGGGGTSGQ